MTSLLDTNRLGAREATARALAVIVDDSAYPITYVGKAPTGCPTTTALWQIMKLDESSGLVITWANGNSNFSNVWDDRASLTYT